MSVKIPNPPGGKLTCPVGYKGAVIRHLDGSITASCLPIAPMPGSGYSDKQLLNKYLEAIKGEKNPNDMNVSQFDYSILKKGYFKRESGSEVWFENPLGSGSDSNLVTESGSGVLRSE